MTRKEAIERIKIILEECIEDEDAVSYVTSYDADALDMAIKALKQEPCEDCISRQAAIDALHMHLMYRMGTDSNKKRLDEWINNLPSAQPTIEPRKKGKWISCENETGEGSNTYKCSACGEIQMIISGTPKENGWAYCPHCGAKMNEVEE